MRSLHQDQAACLSFGICWHHNQDALAGKGSTTPSSSGQKPGFAWRLAGDLGGAARTSLRERTRLHSPGKAVAGGSPGPSVFQLVAGCSWWAMVASMAASGPLLLSPVTLASPSLESPSSALHPSWLRSYFLGVPPTSGPPSDLLAAEGLLQSVHLLGAAVRAPCPKNMRNRGWGARGWCPARGRAGPVGSAPQRGLVRHRGSQLAPGAWQLPSTLPE